uniref:Uncharacterized protein n=1 Tax=Glossina pallidipes TaxID=7398 RepID=A0A1A9Z363_GLOPL
MYEAVKNEALFLRNSNKNNSKGEGKNVAQYAGTGWPLIRTTVKRTTRCFRFAAFDCQWVSYQGLGKIPTKCTCQQLVVLASI